MTRYWWTKVQNIPQISISPADFPFKPGTPAALAQEAIRELDASWQEAQDLYVARVAELERLQSIGTEPVIVGWQDDPAAVMTVTPTETEIETHEAVVKKLLERRTEIERALNRQKGVIRHASDELTRALSSYNVGCGEYIQHVHAARHDRNKSINCVDCSELLAVLAVRATLIQKVYKALTGQNYDRRRYGELFDG